MTDVDFKNAVIVVHGQLADVTDEEIEEAIAPATVRAGTSVVRLPVRALKLDELSELDWGAEHSALRRHVEEQVDPLLVNARPLVYFGMAPIPLTIDLAARISTTKRATVFQQRHDTKSWSWPGHEQGIAPQITGIPDVECPARGGVILRVSCSHRVNVAETRPCVPELVGEVDVFVEDTGEDVLGSAADVDAFAQTVGDAFDAIQRQFPHCDTIHLFAAVPPALAFRVGTEVNPTLHPPVQTYQYRRREEPRYVRALVIGENAAPHLTDEDRRRASEARVIFARALDELPALASSEGLSGWDLSKLGASVPFPTALEQLGHVDGNRALVASTVAQELHDADGEFRWDSAENLWVFDDSLLSALAARLDAQELRMAGRLFFLHEGAHIQTQGLTSATASGIGRLPRVLEEADYLADVWAILHELGRALLQDEIERGESADYLRTLVRLVTSTFWAFDAGDSPLRSVQVRRLNRYLIWYWQRLRLESCATLDEAVRVLGEKPVLEISGPRIALSRGRVMFDLSPSHFSDVEFGVLLGGFRITRVGTGPSTQVDRLLGALREGDAEAFLGTLRGIYDSVDGNGT